VFPRLSRKRAAVVAESFEDRRVSYAVLVSLREAVVSLPADLVSCLEELLSQRDVLRESFGDRRQRDADRRQLDAVLGLLAKCLELQRKERR
jgi:hypothetical protein